MSGANGIKRHGLFTFNVTTTVVRNQVSGFPLVTPYYCRLGDCCVLCLLCHYCIFSVNCVIYVCLQYFDTVGWVLRPVKNRRPYNLYCVVGDVKPCSINQSIQGFQLKLLLCSQQSRWMIVLRGGASLAQFQLGEVTCTLSTWHNCVNMVQTRQHHL